MALDRTAQRRLTAEIVESRAEEIRRAYSAVIGVGYGFRTRGRWTNKGGDRRTVTDEPCVVLMVTRKWRKRPKTPAALSREVPDHLLAFCDVAGPDGQVRRLCAVPVDVIESADHRASPQNGVNAERSTARDEDGVRPDDHGSFTALVVPRGGGPTYAVSCFHFAAKSNDHNLGKPVRRASFTLKHDSSAGTFGDLSPYMGRLVSPDELSLDVALVEVRPGMLDVARRAVGPRRPTRVIPSTDLPPEEVLICVTQDKPPVRARFVIAHKNFDKISYFPAGYRQPRHSTIWEFEVLKGGPTAGGDSGCAVINGLGDTLLAIHVAGVGDTKQQTARSFAVPVTFALYGPNIGLQDFLDPIP